MKRPQLRLRGALLVGTLIPLLIVALVAIVVTFALSNSLNDADALQRSTRILYRAGLVTKDVLDAETGMRGFVITGQESFLDPYTGGTAALASDADTLRTILVTDPDQAARLQAAVDGFADWQVAIATPAIAAVRSGDTPAADSLVAQGGKLRMDGIRADLAALTSAEVATASVRAAAVRDFNTTVRRISFYGTLIAIILGVVIAILFARRISRRVRGVAGAAAALADGNLAERVTVTGVDEIADLGNAFNRMAGKLETAAAAEQEAAEALRQRSVETEIANRELEAFSYSVSHDLRAPLRSIDGFSQALLEDYSDGLDAAGRDYIHRVRAASQRMAALIDDLLRLSRISREPIRSEPIDLSAMATSIVAELRAAEPDRAVAVTVAPGLRATGDTRLVRIALENLIGNAWKFTRERPDPKVEVGQEAGPEGPEFVVSDNGAGFDMRYAANLFGPFQRMHPVERFAGTGIGLATVQRIIARHGGTIGAESEVGNGARFRFTLGHVQASGSSSGRAAGVGSGADTAGGRGSAQLVGPIGSAGGVQSGAMGSAASDGANMTSVREGPRIGQ